MSESIYEPNAGYFMTRKPVASVMALLLAIVITLVAAAADVMLRWGYLQRHYLGAYVQSTLRAPIVPYQKPYRIAFMLSSSGGRVRAAGDDVVVDEKGPKLSDARIQRGYLSFRWVEQPEDNRVMRDWLRTDIYYRLSWVALFTLPLVIGALTLLIGLVYSLPADIRNIKRGRSGDRIRGCEMVTNGEFNRRQIARQGR